MRCRAVSVNSDELGGEKIVQTTDGRRAFSRPLGFAGVQRRCGDGALNNCDLVLPARAGG